jgi:hypothetical protein
LMKKKVLFVFDCANLANLRFAHATLIWHGSYGNWVRLTPSSGRGLNAFGGDTVRSVSRISTVECTRLPGSYRDTTHIGLRYKVPVGFRRSALQSARESRYKVPVEKCFLSTEFCYRIRRLGTGGGLLNRRAPASSTLYRASG